MVLRGFHGHSSAYNQSRHVVPDGVSQPLYKQVHRLSGATEIKPREAAGGSGVLHESQICSLVSFCLLLFTDYAEYLFWFDLTRAI